MSNLGNIYVAGHNGMVGSALTRHIDLETNYSWIGANRSDLDLRSKNDVIDFVGDNKPTSVIIAAAKVGGILANSNFPVEFLTENLEIQANLMAAAHIHQIKNLLFLGSSCIYPKMSQQPIKEEYLLTGPLEQSNEAYAIAKIAGVKMVQAYRKQYGYKWISLMPTNLYGPKDNFDLQTSHVLPAMIRKFHEAKINNLPTVTLWGSGSPLREFMHVDDLADACLFLLSNYDSDQTINVGVGSDLSIKELSNMIKAITNYSGDVDWDVSKPDGTPRKLLDSTKLNNLGWKAKIDLESGIRSVYDWYLVNTKSTSN